MEMKEIEISNMLLVDDFLEKSTPCLSDEDCACAEVINKRMEELSLEYCSMSEQSYRYSEGLRLTQ